MHSYKLISLRRKNLNLKNKISGLNVFKKFIIFILVLVIVLYYTIQIYESKTENYLSNLFKTHNKYLEDPLKDNYTFATVKFTLNKYIKPVRYNVRTENCKIPWIDPFNAEAKKIFIPEKPIECAGDEYLVSTKFDVKLRRYVLQLNFKEESDIKCCYQEIVRSKTSNSDDSYDLLPCVNFHQNFVVPLHVEFAIITCRSGKTNETVQKDAFSFIQDKNLTANVNVSEDSVEKPNVLLIGIDSLSRMNFRRNMPKTMEYLNRSNWFELEGYNKVGDNTFPNLMPLLTGITEEMANTDCNPKATGGLDNCTFIWDDFKRHGYLTAYAEDVPVISTFNYLKEGFLMPPTDYYLRPMLVGIEDNMPTIKYVGLVYCIGRRKSASYVYDFGFEFANRFHGHPKFSFLWTNSFSHNWFTSPSTMDDDMGKYFEKLEYSGTMENSIIIFFSDHGCRWGPLLSLPEGFFEERLPMFFIWLPQKFRKSYPDLVKALEVNRNRLTTPFDIYQTLKHIMSLGTSDIEQLKSPKGCVGARSIFHVVPESRTCKHGCIPEHWCTCTCYEVLPVDNPLVKNVTELIVLEINNFLRISNFSTLCSPLEVATIEEAQLKIDEPEKMSPIEVLRIKFTVTPSDATFQATAFYDILKQSIKLVLEDISRLGTYGKDSKCINEKSAKKFCICRK